MPHPPEHLGNAGYPDFDDRRNNELCLGPIHAAYIREGAAGRWLKIGRICRRCYYFWPDSPPEGLPLASAGHMRSSADASGTRSRTSVNVDHQTPGN